MIKTHRPLLMLSLLLASQTMAGVAAVRAGETTLQTSSDFKGQNLSEGGFEKSHFIFTADARVGYDDNTLAQPDSVRTVFVDPITLQRRTVNQNVDTSDSVFFNFDIGAGYNASTPRSTLSLGADVGVNYYLDRPGRDYDVNGGLTLAFTYKLTPRALFTASSYNAYTSSADFGASNLTNFNGQGINNVNNISGTTAGNRSGDFFYTSNRISLAYQWTQRFSTVTGYNLVAFAYKDQPYSTQEDRVEHYLSQEFRYLLAPTVTGVVEYRFGYIGYLNDRTVVGSNGIGTRSLRNDSIENFALVGADFNLSQRLSATFRVGAQFRDYVDYDDNSVSPYVEASVNYNLTRLSSVNFLARYSSEEGDIATSGSDTNTLRLGISYNQALGARLSGYASFYYTLSQYDGTDTFLFDSAGNAVLDNGNRILVYPGSFNENTFDVAVGLRYSVTRFLSAEVGYTHTSVVSGIDVREYDRNRYFGGIRLSF